MKLDMVDHVWRKIDRHQHLWNEVKILDREQHWRIRYLKESEHMQGDKKNLSRLSKEIKRI